MKAIGGVIAWLGGMAMLLGGLFVLLSLKNQADLFVWNFLGLIIGGFGFMMLVAGWAVYASKPKEDRHQELSRDS
ncbi:MAG: hypothetical protein H7Y17_15105 [Chlorobia bacterium]|nr:hypothetical protein [Fimbriimonadaceae bacterium]